MGPWVTINYLWQRVYFEETSLVKGSILACGQQLLELKCIMQDTFSSNRKWQDYVYIQCEYKSTKQKIKHLLREENTVKENKIS